MGMWSRMATAVRRFWNSSLSSPAQWLVDWIREPTSDSGVMVNGKTALEFAPFWYGVNKISGHVGQMPFSTYEKVNDRESVERLAHPGSWVVNNPNDYMDAMVWREAMQGHAIMWGNARSAIVRNGRNDPAEFILLLPDRTVTVLVNGEKWHVVTDLESGEKTKIRDRDVLHIVGFSYDGIQGYSLIEKARNSLGLGLAAEKHTNRHFKSNAIPGLVLEAPPGVLKKEEDAREFMRQWNDYHEGVDKSNKAALLRDGMKVNTLGMSGRDAQWIEQRRFQRQEAALWLMLEQILGDDASVSYNSLEMKNLAYLSVCLNRWLLKWEQQCNRKLLTRQQYESGNWYFKFVRNAILQMTAKERFEIYEKGRTIGMFSPNTCLALEDMPLRKDPEGDRFDNPNTTPGGPAKDSTATDEPPPKDGGATDDESDINDRLTALIKSRLRGLLIVESQQAKKAAANEHNFCQAIEGAYAGDFAAKLRSVYEQCGGTVDQALAHAAESRATLLEVAGKVTTLEALRARVGEIVELWPDRAEAIAEIILSERATK
jgi:HK97 family phage portal protein